MFASAGTRGELCGCCGSESCSWQNCLWCCCRRGPRAEKNPAGEIISSRGKLQHFFQGQTTSGSMSEEAVFLVEVLVTKVAFQCDQHDDP